jgi:hypothetical protein
MNFWKSETMLCVGSLFVVNLLNQFIESAVQTFLLFSYYKFANLFADAGFCSQEINSVG